MGGTRVDATPGDENCRVPLRSVKNTMTFSKRYQKHMKHLKNAITTAAHVSLWHMYLQ
jgi:hypothetical protein